MAWSNTLQNKMKAFAWLLLLLALMLIFVQQKSRGIKIETNILALLPTTEADPFAEKAFNKFSDKNLQQAVFMVGHTDKEISQDYAKQLNRFLSESPYVESLASGMTTEQQKEIGKQIFKYRYHLLSPEDAERLKSGAGQYFVDSSLQMLFSPLSSSIAPLMVKDPFLLSYRFSNQSGPKSKVNVELLDAGVTFSDKSKFYTLINARLAIDSFSSELSTNFIPKLELLESQWTSETPDIELLRTGSVFYASHGMKTAKQEISTIGLGSLIAVLSLLTIAFFSIRPLLLSSLALGFGIASGFVGAHLIFSEIHILTLVFGASLVGVAIDYAFHYFASATTTSKPLKKILAAISMGLISSIVGYLALLFTPFPGLQQMAVFCILGLSGAFLTVVLFFEVIPLSLKHPLLLVNFSKKLMLLAKSISQKVPVATWVIFPLLALSLSYFYTKNNDDIRQLQSIPTHLKQQEDLIFKMLDSPASNQFFIVKATEQSELLEKMQTLAEQLSLSVKNEAISNYTAFTNWVPAPSKQNSNYQLIKHNLFVQSSGSLLEQYQQIGLFNDNSIGQLFEDFKQRANDVLTLDSWLESPLGQQLDYLWLDKIDGQYAAVVALSGVKNVSALNKVGNRLDDIYFINKVDKVSALFKDYRIFVSQALVMALIIIFMLLSFKYGFKLASLILLSPVCAVSISLLGLMLAGESINLFNTLALFLIIGIGIDYGLFFAESKTISSAIVIAIGLSALTTTLSFGLLSLSQTPAIHLFGLTMLMGISSVFILSLIVGNTIHKQVTT